MQLRISFWSLFPIAKFFTLLILLSRSGDWLILLPRFSLVRNYPQTEWFRTIIIFLQSDHVVVQKLGQFFHSLLL